MVWIFNFEIFLDSINSLNCFISFLTLSICLIFPITQFRMSLAVVHTSLRLGHYFNFDLGNRWFLMTFPIRNLFLGTTLQCFQLSGGKGGWISDVHLYWVWFSKKMHEIMFRLKFCAISIFEVWDQTEDTFWDLTTSKEYIRRFDCVVGKREKET